MYRLGLASSICTAFGGAFLLHSSSLHLHANASVNDESEEWESEEYDKYAFMPERFEDIRSQDNVEIRVFGGTGNHALAVRVAEQLHQPLGKMAIKRYEDGEVSVQVIDSVRGKDVYIIQPTCPPINDNMVELFLMISALRRASAGRITAVIPYYGYSRQDRKRAARETIAAADIARMLEAVGVDHVIAVDLHRGQIQGFFDTRTPVDNLDAIRTVVVPYFLKKRLNRPVVISASGTGANRAIRFRNELKSNGKEAGLAFVTPESSIEFKDTGHHHRVPHLNDVSLVGNVKGCDVIIVDDMIDTGSRMCLAAVIAHQAGASRVFGFCTHGLFSGTESIERIEDSPFLEVVLCDTIPPRSTELETSKKIKFLSVDNVIAEAILRLHHRESLGTLTDQRD